MKDRIAKFLKEKRKLLRLSADYVADQLSERGFQISPKTLYGYEGGTRQPDIAMLMALCEIYGVENVLLELGWSKQGLDGLRDLLSVREKQHLEEYNKLNEIGQEKATEYIKDLTQILEYQKSAGKQNLIRENMVQIKVYNQKASAGLGSYLQEDSDRDFTAMDFPSSKVPKGTEFGVKIKGDSMSPLIEDGQIVFVKSVPKVEDKRIGIFVIDGEAYCKKIIRENDKVYFRSINAQYKDMELTEYMTVNTVGEVFL